MYWSNTRASVRCWVGEAGETQNKFSRGRSETASFGRGRPFYISARATPALSSDAVQPMVYGPGPSEEFYATDSRLGNVVTIATDSLVFSPAKVSPDDLYVYYVSENGILYQADAMTLEQRWSYAVAGRVEGDIALNSAGTMLYVGTTSGDIFGIEVAIDLDFVAATAVPSLAPSMSIAPTTSSVPSLAPVSPPTVAPVTAPTLAPTDLPTSAPSSSFGPSEAPAALTSGPTQMPVTLEPTSGPTFAPTQMPQSAQPTKEPTTEAPTAMPSLTSAPSGAMPGAVASILALVFSVALLVL
jgi:hypothetical protein